MSFESKMRSKIIIRMIVVVLEQSQFLIKITKGKGNAIFTPSQSAKLCKCKICLSQCFGTPKTNKLSKPLSQNMIHSWKHLGILDTAFKFETFTLDHICCLVDMSSENDHVDKTQVIGVKT